MVFFQGATAGPSGAGEGDGYGTTGPAGTGETGGCGTTGTSKTVSTYHGKLH